MPPLISLIIITAVMMTPTSASSAPIPVEENVPSRREDAKGYMPSRVDGLSTTSLAFCKPIKVINRPMPQETPYFRHAGMELKIASRMLVTDRTINTRPSTKTAASAACQL